MQEFVDRCFARHTHSFNKVFEKVPCTGGCVTEVRRVRAPQPPCLFVVDPGFERVGQVSKEREIDKKCGDQASVNTMGS